VTIRLAGAADAPEIAAIYAPYVLESAASFETEAPDSGQMRARILEGGALYPWFVAIDEETGKIAGYAYATAFRTRRAYRFAVETTVYLAPGRRRRGLGSALYGVLLPLLEAQGFSQAIAAITLPNEASVRLHERLGFEPAGVYRDVGHKLGAWRSVGLWQRGLAPLSETPAEPRPYLPLLAAGPR
jgi:phosphinothricin acetyltransferase